MQKRPLLDRWVVYGNTLVGYVYDSAEYSRGARIQTDAIRFVDVPNRSVECLHEVFRLGDPGTYAEHNVPLLGQKIDKPYAELPKIDNKIFLQPNG